LARKFLYVIAVLIVLAIVALFALRMFSTELSRIAFVPTTEFTPEPPMAQNAYADPNMWLARPDLGNNPALWTPPGVAPVVDGEVATFFIHPTSYLGKERWNAALDDAETNDRAGLFLRGQASAFNGVGAVWAPRYRQATFGAFLTSVDSANQALDLAYRDVAQAFDQFLEEVGDRPIVLAGHSQGGLHLTRLLAERVANTPLAERVVAAYVVGWPVSETADLPALGLAECRSEDQANCIASWQSFGEPADPSLIYENFDGTTGFAGSPRAGTQLICTNPLTGRADDAAPAEANLGGQKPSSDLTSAEIVAGLAPARCDNRGLLLIGEGPEMGPYVLPGNNYHVYDYSLFWSNIRADVARRVEAFGAR